MGSMIYIFAGWTIYAAMKHPYFSNPMIYLPFILMGIDKIYKKEKPYIFIWSVALAGLSNFTSFICSESLWCSMQQFDILNSLRIVP